MEVNSTFQNDAHLHDSVLHNAYASTITIFDSRSFKLLRYI